MIRVGLAHQDENFPVGRGYVAGDHGCLFLFIVKIFYINNNHYSQTKTITVSEYYVNCRVLSLIGQMQWSVKDAALKKNISFEELSHTLYMTVIKILPNISSNSEYFNNCM